MRIATDPLQRQLALQRMQVEAAVEVAGAGAELVMRIIAIAKGMVSTAKAGLEVAEDGVPTPQEMTACHSPRICVWFLRAHCSP